MSKPLLSINNLQVCFSSKLGPLKAVDDVSYCVNKGETLGIVGESGCGKSVTSLALIGLLEENGSIEKGSILFNDQELTNYTESQFLGIRGKQISMIFQEPMTALNPVFTIGFQMDEQIFKHSQASKAEAKEISIEMLHTVGIPSPRKRYANYPHQLSGGMRQRAMIAMALSCNPQFLIADEPTTALDVTIQAQILDLMLELQERMDMTIQFITHDLGVLSEIADNVMVMYAGRIYEKADAKTIFSNPRHPYTYGLVASIPQIKKRVDSLYSIPGNVPSLTELPMGCHFQNRCPNVTEQCRQQIPELQTIEKGHEVGCFNLIKS